MDYWHRWQILACQPWLTVETHSWLDQDSLGLGRGTLSIYFHISSFVPLSTNIWNHSCTKSSSWSSVQSKQITINTGLIIDQPAHVDVNIVVIPLKIKLHCWIKMRKSKYIIPIWKKKKSLKKCCCERSWMHRSSNLLTSRSWQQKSLCSLLLVWFSRTVLCVPELKIKINNDELVSGYFFPPSLARSHAAFVPGGLLLNVCVVTQPTVCNAWFICCLFRSHPCLCEAATDLSS